MISQDMADRMQDIIRKHGEAYRQDLPVLVGQLAAHMETLISSGSDEVLPVLQREAHDMKGQGATFGLTGISAVAASISRILEASPPSSPKLTQVLQTHVSALKSLLEKDDPDLVAKTLATAQGL